MVRLSVGDTSRLGCWFALKVTRSGGVAWHSWRHLIFRFFFFFSSLRQHHTDKAAIYKACVQPFVSAQLQLSSTVTGGRIDCALCLTLCFSCHFEVRDQNQDGTQRWQWSASTYQKLQNTAQCNTHSVIQLTQFSHALVANTVMA